MYQRPPIDHQKGTILALLRIKNKLKTHNGKYKHAKTIYGHEMTYIKTKMYTCPDYGYQEEPGCQKIMSNDISNYS